MHLASLQNYENMCKNQAILSILERYWGYRSFRPNQQEIIESVLEGRDTLVLMPTGGGKSLCFQIPALAKEGICIVVSPLIALITDQVQNLNNRGIKALAVYSGMTYQQIDQTLDNAVYGDYKLLYVSPERLATPLFKARAAKMNISMLVVDEAHCISQWGYDFRPAYLQIAEIKEIIGKVTTMALTATATPVVADDIVSKLQMSSPAIFRTGFERPNLSYVVRKVEDKIGNMIRVCRGVQGSGIVYVRERKRAEELSKVLSANGITSSYYHAGLSKEVRRARQDAWKENRIRVIVATNAFGMGIDKPDVRFVVHYDLPDAVEAYFQEAGRAGRDGERSYATLLWNSSDLQRLRQIYRITFPPIDYIKEIYQKVFLYLQIPYEEGKDTSRKFVLSEFANHFKLNQLSAFYAIKYIEQEGYWELTDEVETPSRIMFKVSRSDLYLVQLKNSALDAFIKALLRLYGGLFTQPVIIDEEYIARLTNDSTDGVVSKLQRLAAYNILVYSKSVRSPLIIFNNERLTEDNLYISSKRYQERRERLKDRLDAMVAFVQNGSECRSRQLIKYFGIEPAGDCGICDVCLNNKKIVKALRQSGSVERELLALQERAAGRGEALSLEEVMSAAGEHSELYLEVYREMVDAGLLPPPGKGLS